MDDFLSFLWDISQEAVYAFGLLGVGVVIYLIKEKLKS